MQQLRKRFFPAIIAATGAGTEVCSKREGPAVDRVPAAQHPSLRLLIGARMSQAKTQLGCLFPYGFLSGKQFLRLLEHSRSGGRAQGQCGKLLAAVAAAACRADASQRPTQWYPISSDHYMR